MGKRARDRGAQYCAQCSTICSGPSVAAQRVLLPCQTPHRDPCKILLCTVYPANLNQGYGSGSAWIRIRFTSWIRIRIQYADPDPGGKIFQIKTEKGKEIANNCNFIQFLK